MVCTHHESARAAWGIAAVVDRLPAISSQLFALNRLAQGRKPPVIENKNRLSSRASAASRELALRLPKQAVSSRMGNNLVPCVAKIAAILLCTVVMVACHSQTEKHTLIISGAVHVYPSETPPVVYPGTTFIEVLGPQDHVKVRQVLYKNGYMAVKVRLEDGREGWVFSGESIELR